MAKLAGLVKLHLRDEDEQLYPRLLQHPDDSVRAVAAEFRTTMGGLADDFLRYYAAWVGGDRIESESAAFFAASDAILQALALRMDREDQELYAIADRSAEIGFRP